MSQRPLRLRELHREAAAARALHQLVFQTFRDCTAPELAEKVAHAVDNIKFDEPEPAVHFDSQFLRLRRLLTRAEWDLLPLTAHQMRVGVKPRFESDGQRIKEVERERRRKKRLQSERERARVAEIERERSRASKRLARVRRDRVKLGELRELRDRHSRRLRERIISELDTDFLGIDRHVATQWTPGFPRRTYYEKLKARFVGFRVRRALGLDLDEEQGSAVGAVNGNVLVTARAGSGKTRVLTTRAVFLQQHCGVPPHQIMLLAFNRAAAEEMQNRLRDQLGDSIPHVMTFHALGNALAPPRKDGKRLLYDDRDDGTLHLTEMVQQVIDEFVRNDQRQGRIRELMLAHFEADWGRIESGGYHLSGDEFIRFRRSLTHETLNGERVRNFGQKAIANALLEHDIPYRFEHSFDWSGRRLRADFFISRSHEDSASSIGGCE